jgi:hypothetical protein
VLRKLALDKYDKLIGGHGVQLDALTGGSALKTRSGRKQKFDFLLWSRR